MRIKSIYNFASAALCVTASNPAFAGEGQVDVISPDTLELFVDVRLQASDGERPWLDGGFGKLRYGGAQANARSDLRVRPEFAEATVVWKPRFSWALSGTVVSTVQNKGKLEPGLSEAFISFKPLTEGRTKVSARAGLMWPAISLEHGGGDWSVTETITPSAINSWVGEEVKVVGLEANVTTRIGASKVELTGGLFDANDTAGAVLSFRGWALHDVKAVAFTAHPLPKLNAFISEVQPRFSTPLLTFSGHDTNGGFGKTPGYYLKAAFEPANLPVRVELLRYDNRGNPEHLNESLEWGWRTKFYNLGLVADLGRNTQLRAQGTTGSTKMGFPMPDRRWIDARYRSAFGLITQRFRWGSVTGRVEAFGTRNQGSALTSDDDENGWAVTLAAKRSFNRHATGLIEVVHIGSVRNARLREDLAPKKEPDAAASRAATALVR